MEGFAVMVEAMLGGRGIDRHAADGIAHGGAGVRVVAVAAVIVMPAAAACVRVLGFGHRILRHLQPIPGRGI